MWTRRRDEVRMIRPGVVALMREIASARTAADRHLFRLVELILTVDPAAPRARRGIPERGEAFDRHDRHSADPRPVGRDAAVRGEPKVRACHGLAGGGEAACVVAAVGAGAGPGGVRLAPAHDLRSAVLADEAYRRRITRQLNKGETLHSLRRDLSFAHEGAVRRRHLDQQTEQALCLSLVVNAIITFNTVYLELALMEHVNPYGTYTFPIEKVRDLDGYRPLRMSEPAGQATA